MTGVAGQVALVTGGASGIGLGIVRALTKRGARVAIADIDIDRARAAAGEVGAIAVALDVTKPGMWAEVADAVRTQLGDVRILCNNAGVGGGPGLIEDYDLDVWRWTYEVNVHSLIYSMHAFLPAMKASGERCHIVNTASMVALVPTPNSIAYVSSKFGTLGVTFGLRSELRDHDIGVSLLCPGMSATRIVETSGRLRPGDGAVTAEKMIAMQAVLAGGMSPDAVGEKVARSIEADEFYIFTHPEWGPLYEAHARDVLSGFGESADPGHRDDLDTLLATLNKEDKR